MKLLVTIVALASILFGCNYITSGERGGRYYNFAQTLSSKVDNVCVQKSKGTPRNIYNIIENKSIVMGLFQSDNMKLAKMYDKKARLKNLEVLFPVFSEQIHVIVLKTSPLKTLTDLAKRDIAVGDELSGSYLSFLNISKQLDMDWKGINYSFVDGMSKLRNGEVDAVFLVSTAPVKALEPYAGMIKFLTINEQIRGYNKSKIPATAYTGMSGDVATLSVDTLLMIDNAKVNSENKAIIAKLANAYIDMRYITKPKSGTGFKLDFKMLEEGTKALTDMLGSITGGNKKKEINKTNIDKVEDICQTNTNSMARFDFPRSKIAVDVCNKYKAKVK